VTDCINATFGLGNEEKVSICTLELDSKKVQQFADAIENSYWFEFFIGMWIYFRSIMFYTVMMIWDLLLISDTDVFHLCRYQLFFVACCHTLLRRSASLG
jgi:hypothetical protein